MGRGVCGSTEVHKYTIQEGFIIVMNARFIVQVILEYPPPPSVTPKHTFL